MCELCIYVQVHKLIEIIVEPADCWHRDYYCLLLKLISISLQKHFPQLSDTHIHILMASQIGCQADYFTTYCILVGSNTRLAVFFYSCI